MDENTDNSLQSEANGSEENLLEAVAEISYHDRETYSEDASKLKKVEIRADKENGPNSLPDARARILQLKRVQGRKDKNSAEISDQGDLDEDDDEEEDDGEDGTEKEETVSFSLESIIRRGLGEQKINTNFQKDFPDFESSEEAAQHLNTLLTSNPITRKHDQDGRSTNASDSEMDGTESVDESLLQQRDEPPPKKRRGRPKLTDEQRQRKMVSIPTTSIVGLSGKRRGRPRKVPLVDPLGDSHLDESKNAPETAVDQLLALGHSLFSECEPKKRGRKPKKDTYFQEFYNATQTGSRDISIASENEDSKSSVPLDQFNENPIIFRNSEFTVGEIPVNAQRRETTSNGLSLFPKKRGRKPKYLLTESSQKSLVNNGESSFDGNQSVTLHSIMPGVAQPKKRGRKPKFVYFQNETHDDSGATSQLNESSPQQSLLGIKTVFTIKKKRGRKPKSFYIQQQQQKYMNTTAPAQLETVRIPKDVCNKNELEYKYSPTNLLNTTRDLIPLKKKRGRKPKGYYENLILTKETDFSQTTSTGNNSSVSFSRNDSQITNTDTSLASPNMPKKRGRKPKSYYLQLQQQQAVHFGGDIENHSTPVRINTTSGSDGHSQYDSYGNEPSYNSSGHLTHKRVSALTIKKEIQPKLNRLQQPLLPRKRGRPPKNYGLENSVNVVRHYIQRTNIPNVASSPHNRNEDKNAAAIIDYNKILETKNKELLAKLETRNTELRALKIQIASNNANGQKSNGASICVNDEEWNQADLAKGFAMQKMSNHLFKYVRDNCKITLPNQHNVNEFIHNIHLSRGMQQSILEILHQQGNILPTHERLTILQTSVIRTAEVFEYHEQTDTIWGPNKFIVVIVANGLYGNWNQLVYVDFDVRINKSILLGVIEALHKINFQVVGCTCNFDDGQSDIWAELEVSHCSNFFAHPLTGSKIYAFYYLDDLLAATNKYFIKGILSLDGFKLTRDALLQIIQRIYRKVPIDKELLEWTDGDVTNIRATRRFFSQYTVDLLRTAAPDDKGAKNTAEFINIMKALIDLMSKRCIPDIDSVNLAMGAHLEYQRKKIKRVHARLFKIQCNQPNKNFREAITMTLESLKLLQDDYLKQFKYPSFNAYITSNEFLKHRIKDTCEKHNFDIVLPPIQTFRVFKDVFLSENCSIKLDPKEVLFFVGPMKNEGHKESYYVNLLFDWIVNKSIAKYPTKQEQNNLRGKLKKMEDMLRLRQDPNFRIRKGAVSTITKKLVVHGFGVPPDIIQTFVLQRHLLRIKYLNENGITTIPPDVQSDGSSILATITLDE